MSSIGATRAIGLSHVIRPSRLVSALCLIACAWAVAGCNQLESIPNGSSVRNDLKSMRTAEIKIKDSTKYSVYLALSDREQQVGLMNTPEDDLPRDRGMLFIFDYDRYQSFWMRNTIIPLDIAYIRSDGTIVKTWTMKALDESGYPSIEPAQFVLELRAGELAAKSIGPGDHVEIPADIAGSNGE